MKIKTQLECANCSEQLKGNYGIEIRIHLDNKKICYYACSRDCASEIVTLYGVNP